MVTISYLTKESVRASVIILALSAATNTLAQSTGNAIERALAYTVKIRNGIDTPFIEDLKGAGFAAGFLVDVEKGWIVTNAHVAGHSPARLQVRFREGDFFDAEQLYVDPYLDLAVLKIPPSKLPPGTNAAEFECEQNPPVGEAVAALGHPWSLPFTATRGIISGSSFFDDREWLQTDAPLNAGNSGGPLINLTSGKVVGIGTASVSDDESENLNFAVAAKFVCRVLDILRDGKDPSPPQLWALFVSNLQERDRLVVADTFGRDGNTPLKRGDTILRVEGNSATIRNESQLLDILRGKDGHATMIVERNGQETSIDIALSPVPNVLSRYGLRFSGLLVAESPLRDDYDSTENKRLMVHYVEEGSIADFEGFSEWHIILAVDGAKFRDLESLRAYLIGVESSGKNVSFLVRKWTSLNDRLREYWQFEIPIQNVDTLVSEAPTLDAPDALVSSR